MDRGSASRKRPPGELWCTAKPEGRSSSSTKRPFGPVTHDYAHEGAYQYLEEMRGLLWAGKQDEAQKLGNSHFMSQPLRQLSYQPFGNILLNFPGHDSVKNYRRHLDLQDAISSVFYEVDGVQYKREVFASNPDQAIVIRLESSENGGLTFTAGLDSPHSDYEVSVESDQMILLKEKLMTTPGKRNRTAHPIQRAGSGLKPG